MTLLLPILLLLAPQPALAAPDPASGRAPGWDEDDPEGKDEPDEDEPDEDEPDEDEPDEDEPDEDEEDLDDLDFDLDLDEEPARPPKKKKPAQPRPSPERPAQARPPDLDEPAAEEPDYRWNAELGLGGSFLRGGNGEAWSPGFSQQFAFEVRLGRLSWFSFGVAHSRHRMQDASAYFPDHEVTPGAVEGVQVTYDPELSFRIGLPLRGIPDSGVRGWPFLRLGLGVDRTITRLQLPSFDGQRDYMSYMVLPYFCYGLGAELRFHPRLSLVPELRAWAVGYGDGSETGGAAQWGVQTRLEPTLALHLLF